MEVGQNISKKYIELTEKIKETYSLSLNMKDEQILKSLYRKHKNLAIKNRKIEVTILAYDGIIPDYFNKSDKLTETTDFIKDYPKTGTWKDKIYCILTHKGPLTAVNIAKYVLLEEPDINVVFAERTVSQYCSSLAIGGTLKRTRFGKRYIYSIYINQDYNE